MGGYSIVLGCENDSLIEISSKDNQDNLSYIEIPHLDCLKDFASVAFQAAPSILTQTKVANTSIMEVVVNGNLMKAADGNGFRASVKGPDGKFIENARLFEPESLSNLVNAAAVWQIASVVVAQKHLADISQKLDDLKGGINRIQNFQQKERQTKVLAISNFLKEKLELITQGEQYLSITQSSLVADINNYYVELDQISMHLKDDLITYGLQKTEHKEMFGSADFQISMKEKIHEIQKYIELLYFCIDLKSMSLSILEYLGESHATVKYRRNTVSKEIENLHTLVQQIRQSILGEVRELKSYVNDIQSKIINNKKSALIGTSIFGLPGGAIGVALGDNFSKDGQKTNVLEKRKQDLIASISRSQAYSMGHAEKSKKLAITTIASLVESSKPLKLAFKRFDDNYVICLNTNEKILVPV